MVTKMIIQFYEKTLTTFDYLTILILAFEIIVITTNVILRYVFHSSLGWMDEFATYGLIWLTFAGSVRLMEEYGHFHVNVLTSRIRKSKVQKGVYIFDYVLMILYFAVVIYYGTSLCVALSRVYAKSLHVPKSLMFSIIPIASVICIAVLAKKIIEKKGS